MAKNVDYKTVEGFGDEWSQYKQTLLEQCEYDEMFQRYFSIFPWSEIGENPRGFDLGCGSGRWARGVAPKVGELHCIDASEKALEVARENLAAQKNCIFHHASVDEIPVLDSSMDFGYSLGVLHHIPDTQEGLNACVSKLKPGAPFLLYLYYAFDNRPYWFRALWKLSEIGRVTISRLPHRLKHFVCEIIAATIYFPLARVSLLLSKLGLPVGLIPLSSYRENSFYTMKTDAYDRFGTRLEQRFTRREIEQMMDKAGLENIRFSEEVPFWCAIGYKKR